MRFRKEVLEADAVLHEASKALPFSTVTPLNEQKVRTEFLKGKVRNPILTYAPPTGDLLALRRKVSAVNLDEQELIDSILIDKQADIIRKIDLFNSLGCFDFTERSKKLYGAPDKRLVDKAYDVLNEPAPPISSKRMLAKDAVKLLRDNFKHHGLKYTIRRDDLVGSCDVEPTHGRITLKKKERFSKHFMNKLVIHEIGVHCFRYENGKQQKLNVFRHGLADYLETEEGLALYMEEQFNLLPSLHTSATSVVAVHTALHHDFANTFKELSKYVEKKKAFRYTLRAKRGLADTSFEGGYTKDHLYFKGYHAVKNFIKKGGTLEELYVGKVAIKDIPLLNKLGLKKPAILPKDFLLVGE